MTLELEQQATALYFLDKQNPHIGYIRYGESVWKMVVHEAFGNGNSLHVKVGNGFNHTLEDWYKANILKVQE